MPKRAMRAQGCSRSAAQLGQVGRLVPLALLVVGACAGPSFETTGAGGSAGSGGKPGGTGGRGAGAAGTGGVFNGAGTAGGSIIAGRNGSGGSDAGAAGLGLAGEAGAADGCHCRSAQYCRAGSCYDCADLSQLDFDTPELILDHPTQNLRFPRPGATPDSLFFTLAATPVRELWYEASVDDPPGASLGTAPTPSRSGLFFVNAPGKLGFDVLFDEVATDGHRVIRSASFDAGVLETIADAPKPLNASGFDDYSPTLASTSARAYWMSTRGGSPALYSGVLGGGEAGPLAVKITANGTPGVSCDLDAGDSGDAAPWVSADGALLVVSALPEDGSCQPVDGSATDVFVMPLNPASGQPAAPAVELAGVNFSTGASSETDAAFSSDRCALYFASDGGTEKNFDFRLFRAVRR